MGCTMLLIRVHEYGLNYTFSLFRKSNDFVGVMRPCQYGDLEFVITPNSTRFQKTKIQYLY